MQRSAGGDGKELLHASPAAMDASFSLMRGLLPFASGKTFRTAPPVFRETMLFGYLKGMVFVLHLTNEGEWASVDRAFKNPPVSTEQILHPEKYLNDVDAPVAIDLPELSDVVGDDWNELGRNVLGELQISILLRKHWGPRAAAGWDGDRYAVFRGPDGQLGLVWFTTWDTAEDANEFAGAYARYVRGRIGGEDTRSAARDESAPPSVPEHVRLERQGRVYDLIRGNNDVIAVEGFSASLSQRILEAVRKSDKK